VHAVDTVAAGDAFCGGLGAALVRGEPLAEALRWASACGALAATKAGAVPSLPTLDDVQGLLA
jgi:ribokinase